MRRERIVIWICLVLAFSALARAEDEKEFRVDVQYLGSELEQREKFPGHTFGRRHDGNGISGRFEFALADGKLSIGYKGQFSDLRRPRHFFSGGIVPLPPENSRIFANRIYGAFDLPLNFRAISGVSHFLVNRDILVPFSGSRTRGKVGLEERFLGVLFGADWQKVIGPIEAFASFTFLPGQGRNIKQKGAFTLPTRPEEPFGFDRSLRSEEELIAHGLNLEVQATYWVSSSVGLKVGYEWLQFRTDREDVRPRIKESFTQKGFLVGIAFVF